MATLTAQDRRRLAEAMGAWVERTEPEVLSAVPSVEAPPEVSHDTLVSVAQQGFLELSTVLAGLIITTLEEAPAHIEWRTVLQALDARGLDELLSQIEEKAHSLTETVVEGIETTIAKGIADNPQFAVQGRAVGLTTPDQLARSARSIAANAARELRSPVREVVTVVIRVARSAKSLEGLEACLKGLVQSHPKKAIPGKEPQGRSAAGNGGAKPWWRVW